jgi:hypothetical protein
VADVRGLKIRTAGGAQSNWVRALGGVPVSVPIGDVYSGLERGSIDCTLSDPTNLDKGNKFWEVAKAVTRLPMGVVLGANWIYNRDAWKALTTPQRRRPPRHDGGGFGPRAGRLSCRGQCGDRGLPAARPRHSRPSDDLTAKLAEFNRDFIRPVAEGVDGGAQSVQDPSDLIKAFRNWRRSGRSSRGRRPHQSRRRGRGPAQHLYGKVDAATYGLN